MATESRVLIIENNDVLRVMLFTILRHQPLAVDTATTAAEAIEKTTTCDYALILLDADLPDNDAAEFLRRFENEHPDAPTFIVVVRSAESEPMLDPRVGAVLSKPLEIDTLAELVRECAAVVPPPEEPQLHCPPAESEIRARMDRSGSFYSN
jgi:DNA-binding response OmpR family regulator